MQVCVSECECEGVRVSVCDFECDCECALGYICELV